MLSRGYMSTNSFGDCRGSCGALNATYMKKGSSEPNRAKVGSVNWDQVKTIAETKMPDLNAFTVESAMKMVAGTARSMGLKVTGKAPWDN